MDDKSSERVNEFAAKTSVAVARVCLEAIEEGLPAAGITDEREQIQALIVTSMQVASIIAHQVAAGMSAGVPEGRERRIAHRRLYAAALNNARNIGVRRQFEDIADEPIDLENPK